MPGVGELIPEGILKKDELSQIKRNVCYFDHNQKNQGEIICHRLLESSQFAQ